MSFKHRYLLFINIPCTFYFASWYVQKFWNFIYIILVYFGYIYCRYRLLFNFGIYPIGCCFEYFTPFEDFVLKMHYGSFGKLWGAGSWRFGPLSVLVKTSDSWIKAMWRTPHPWTTIPSLLHYDRDSGLSQLLHLWNLDIWRILYFSSKKNLIEFFKFYIGF